MKNILLYSAFLCLLSLTVKAQTPDWAVDSTRKAKFPESEYLIGFASEKNFNKEEPQALLKRIEAYAKGQLVEYVQVKVQSEAVNEVTENNDNIQKNYRSIYSASSNLELTGLKIEKVYDKRTKMGYAIAYAFKTDLVGYYKGIIDVGLTNAIQKIEEARDALNNNDILHSIKSCFEAGNILPSVEQAQKIILAIKAGKVTDMDIQNERAAKQRASIEEVVRQAQRNSGNTIDEASFFIARGLKLQTGNLNKPVLLSNFTYQDTRMGSELSLRLNQYLTSKLVNEARYRVVTEATKIQIGYVLTGTFWKDEKEIKIIGMLKDSSNMIIATAEAIVPLSWFEANKVNYLPENFDEAYAKMKEFERNEFVKGDLNIEVWTNKGDRNLVYTEGDTLKFFIRANKECYLRFIYHLADGQSTLLLDNYYISENMTNKVVEIPYEFECSEPFGVETLQANAQTTEFQALETTRNDGYDYIVDNLREVLLNTRGFKKVTSNITQKAEKRLIFTTLRK